VIAADACPGIIDLHSARDGQVARIRLPGGYAGATRLRSLAAIAAGCGDGNVDLTARGNVQVRGIRSGQEGRLEQRAAAAGFLPSAAHDRARNIMASPLAGLAGHRGLRTQVLALDRAIRADTALAALPGRFLFCLDDGTGRAGLGSCDVGLRWRASGADLIVAGRETGLRIPAPEAIERVVTTARAFLGDPPDVPAAARVAGLPDGGAGVAAHAGGALGARVTDTTARLPLGLVPDTRPLAVVAAPLARLTTRQLHLVAGLIRRGEVARLASAGRIVLPLAGSAEQAIAELAAAGLLVSDDHALADVTACSGMSCARSLADVRSAATRVSGLGAVHWAGCGRRCGRPADATAVVATSAGRFTLEDGSGRTIPAAAGSSYDARI
jgi:precorrin-3B synthase